MHFFRIIKLQCAIQNWIAHNLEVIGSKERNYQFLVWELVVSLCEKKRYLIAAAIISAIFLAPFSLG
jgi:phosphopantetheinyl transferase (holo-ACP synthase)